MRWTNPGFVALLAVGFLAAAGCQRLDYQTTMDVAPNEVRIREIDAPRKEQKVTVHVSSSGAPVDVYVVLDKDKADAEAALLKEKRPANSLAGKDKVTDDTLEATVPARNPFHILVMNHADTTATVKLTVKGR
jgi:hypothetical protein